MYSFVAHFLGKKFNFDAHYFIKGGFWLGITQIAAIIGGLVSSVLFAHVLPQNDYGTYKYLIGLASLFAAFSLTGLGQSILQTSAKKYFNFYSETIKINFLYSGLVFLVSAAGGCYYFWKDNLILGIGCILIAILQPFLNSFSNTTFYLLGSGRYKENAVMQCSKALFISFVSILALFSTSSVLILVFAFLTASFFSNLVGHVYFKPKEAEKTPFSVLNKYLEYAKHSSLRNIAANVANRADTVLIFTQLGAVELAIYSIASIVPEQIKGGFRNLATLLLPKYAKHENDTVIRKGLKMRTVQLAIFLSLISVLFILAAPYIYSFLFPKYPEAILYSQISALAFPAFISLLPQSLLQSRTEEKALYKLYTYGAIFQILATFLAISLYGVLGAIIARILYRYFFAFLSYKLI